MRDYVGLRTCLGAANRKRYLRQFKADATTQRGLGIYRRPALVPWFNIELIIFRLLKQDFRP
jgi:hypothetical protein